MKANKENPEGSSLYKRKGYLEKRSTRVSPDVPEEITLAKNYTLKELSEIFHNIEVQGIKGWKLIQS